MAVAIGNTWVDSYGTYDWSFLSYEFPYNNVGTGNALLIETWADYYYTEDVRTLTVTYGGQAITQDWAEDNNSYWYYRACGFHLLNAPSGTNTVSITLNGYADFVWAACVSVTGASTTTITSTSKSEWVSGEDTNIYSTLNVPSAVGNLVIAAGSCQTDGYGTGLNYSNGTWISAPVDLSYNFATYPGASSVAVTFGAYSDYNYNSDTGALFTIGAWSIPPAETGDFFLLL